MKRIITVITALLFVLPTGASAVTGQLPPHIICGSGTHYTHSAKPATCVLRFARPTTLTFTKAKWSKWGAPIATAKARAGKASVKVRVSHPITCSHVAFAIYTRIQITMPSGKVVKRPLPRCTTLREILNPGSPGSKYYFSDAAAPVKPGLYQTNDPWPAGASNHFVLSPSARADAVLDGRVFHFQHFLFLEWPLPPGDPRIACSMGAGSFFDISPPGLPNGVAAGRLDGGFPATDHVFEFHGQFIYRGSKTATDHRPNSILITGNCAGFTSQHLFTWRHP